MSNIKKLNIPGLSCLNEHNEASGLFVSRCLNYNLVESGKSWLEAWSNLKIVMKNHMEYWAARKPELLENDRQADKELWDKFYLLIKDNGAIVDQITLEIPEPLPESHEDIWILGSSHQVIHDRAVSVV
jgi:hypothetical protein